MKNLRKSGKSIAVSKNPERIILFILLFAFLLRVPGIFQAAYLDEDEYSLDFWCNCHPPITILSHELIGIMSGGAIWASKLLILIIGLVNIYLTYRISGKLYGHRAAVLASILVSVSGYHLLSSTLLDVDGSFLMLFYLLTAFFFLREEERGISRYHVLTGIGLGLCLLTKYSGIFILPILAVYHLVSKKSILSTIKTFVPITIVGLLMLALYPLLSMIFYPPFFTGSLSHLTEIVSSQNLDIMLLSVQYLLFLVLFGPFLLAIMINSVPRLGKKDLFPLIWIIVIVFLYTFVNRDNFRPLERYFSILIAPVAMISGNYLSNLNIKRRHILIFSLVFAAFTALFLFLNLGGDYMPLYPKDAFLKRAVSFDWDFYLPINGNSGPVGFYINFLVVALGFGISTILAIMALAAAILRKKRISLMLLTVAMAVGFSYNLVFAAEYLFSPTAPNINKITQEVIIYAHDETLPQPIYVFRSSSFRRYLEDKYGDQVLDFNREYDVAKADELREKAGSAIIIDFPIINRDSPLWDALDSCSLVKAFSDKNQTIGYIFDCT